MTGNVKWLKDKQDNIIIPNTLTTSVYDSDGKNVDELLSELSNKNDYSITALSGDKSKTITVNDCADAPIISTKIYGESNGIGTDGIIKIKTMNEDNTQSIITNIPITAPLYDGDYIETDSEGKGYLHKTTYTVVFDGSDDEEWSEGNNGQGFDIDTGDGTSNNTSGKDYGVTYLRYFDKTTMKYCYFDKMASEPNLICSHHFEYKDPKTNDGACIYADPINSIIYLRVSDEINKASEIKAWLQSNPITITYTLKDEVDTDLPDNTLKEIRKLCTFNGITNVTCDGDMEFTYYKNNNGQVVGDLHDQVVRILNEGTNNTNIIEMTQAEYDALSEEVKMDDSIKLITDSYPSDISSILGNLASDYDNTATYEKNDYCLYGGLLYRCTTAITTAEEFDNNKWVKTDCGSEISDLKNNISENSTDIATLLDRLTWKTLTHDAVTLTQVGEIAFTEIATIPNIDEVNEILIDFGVNNTRIGQLHSYRSGSSFSFAFSNMIAVDAYTLAVEAQFGWSDGVIAIRCLTNTWGLELVPVIVPANSIIYR